MLATEANRPMRLFRFKFHCNDKFSVMLLKILSRASENEGLLCPSGPEKHSDECGTRSGVLYFIEPTTFAAAGIERPDLRQEVYMYIYIYMFYVFLISRTTFAAAGRGRPRPASG